MRVLVAEDDPVARRVLARKLEGWGYEVSAVEDGPAALAALRGADPPAIAVLDWEMPGLSGPEVCRQVRSAPGPLPPYLILLTFRTDQADVVAGLASGANDYLRKPVDHAELAARLGVARETVRLQHALADRVNELEAALAQVKQLRGLLPICAWCKSFRSDNDYWQSVEEYLREHANVTFTHAMCPACLERQLAQLRDR